MQKIRLQPMSRFRFADMDDNVKVILIPGENWGDYMGTIATSKYLVTSVFCLENYGPPVVNWE